MPTYKEIVTGMSMKANEMLEDGGGLLLTIASTINGTMLEPFRVTLIREDALSNLTQDQAEMQFSCMVSAMVSMLINEMTFLVSKSADGSQDLDKIRESFLKVFTEWMKTELNKNVITAGVVDKDQCGVMMRAMAERHSGTIQ